MFLFSVIALLKCNYSEMQHVQTRLHLCQKKILNNEFVIHIKKKNERVGDSPDRLCFNQTATEPSSDLPGQLDLWMIFFSIEYATTEQQRDI